MMPNRLDDDIGTIPVQHYVLYPAHGEWLLASSHVIDSSPADGWVLDLEVTLRRTTECLLVEHPGENQGHHHGEAHV